MEGLTCRIARNRLQETGLSDDAEQFCPSKGGLRVTYRALLHVHSFEFSFVFCKLCSTETYVPELQA